ncbi:MAG TPA: dihydroorotase [Trueperaceae bacterium]|nr:dihydroorotase [Trueperaceae bacterium]
MSRVVVRGGDLRDGAGHHGRHDLYLLDGTIEGLDLGGRVDLEVDAEGKLVTPAFLDLHAHLRDPGQEVKEDLASGLAAAAAGGFGTVVSMANTAPVVDDPGIVADLVSRSRAIGKARLRPAAALSRGMRGEQLTDLSALKRAGAVMITDDGVPVADGRLMRSACEYAAELGLVVQTHSEDPSLRADGVMNEGVVSQRLGLPGNPDAAEAVMLFRDGEVARLTGARVHLAHVSSRRGLEVAAWLKASGAPVSVEVTPHHLTLDDEALEGFDPLYKVAPPLRTRADVDHLRRALATPVIDSIGTDHAPHTLAEKQRDMLSAPFGIGNIEVAFPLLYTELVAAGVLPLERLLWLLQDGPARVMGWGAPRLDSGHPADVVVIDLEAVAAVDGGKFASKAKHTPWQGAELSGWPVATLVRGELAFTR